LVGEIDAAVATARAIADAVFSRNVPMEAQVQYLNSIVKLRQAGITPLAPEAPAVIDSILRSLERKHVGTRIGDGIEAARRGSPTGSQK
jgi:hypothetical protein